MSSQESAEPQGTPPGLSKGVKILRGTPEYYEGVAAWREGSTMGANPYDFKVDNDTSTKRIAWFNGWLDQEYQDRH